MKKSKFTESQIIGYLRRMEQCTNTENALSQAWAWIYKNERPHKSLG